MWQSSRAVLLLFVVATLPQISSPICLDHHQQATLVAADTKHAAASSCAFDERLVGRCSGTFEEDFKRQDNLVLAPMWHQRADVAAAFVDNDTRSVLDYGSGTGYLKTRLPARVAYHAVDIRPHTSYEVEVCNINDGFVSRAAPGVYDRIFALGLLE